MMEMFEEAVGLALTGGHTDLAKFYASKPENKSLRTNLWIKISKTQMGQESDLSKLLKDNKDEIRIDDLIPYFHEGIKINSFKEQICDSLTKYNNESARFKVN